MKFYKLYHVPTGLYFKPCRSRFKKIKSNLHPIGKSYDCEPNLSWLRCGVISPEGKFFPFAESEWKIVEYEADLRVLPGFLGNDPSVTELIVSKSIDMSDKVLFEGITNEGK